MAISKLGSFLWCVSLIVFIYSVLNRRLDLPRSEDNNALYVQAHLPRYKRAQPLRISILDSSFNPPTRAHLALAQSKPPKRIFVPGTERQSNVSSTTVKPRRPSAGSGDAVVTQERKPEYNEDDYDARLLLLSVRNVDKTLKPGDATFVQRVEMMSQLACAGVGAERKIEDTLKQAQGLCCGASFPLIES